MLATSAAVLPVTAVLQAQPIKKIILDAVPGKGPACWQEKPFTHSLQKRDSLQKRATLPGGLAVASVQPARGVNHPNRRAAPSAQHHPACSTQHPPVLGNRG